MNSISTWICTNNSNKNLFVKIIYPGGRVEIHDEPIVAAELLRRNPRCCVAHPTVFRHPYAVVSPSTTLALGQKYYIVPIATITKLQRRHSASQQVSDVRLNDGKKKVDYPSPCWLMLRNHRNGCEVKCGKKEAVGLKKSGDHMITALGSTGKAADMSFSHWQPVLERIVEE